jgi:hypothetical protein
METGTLAMHVGVVDVSAKLDAGHKVRSPVVTGVHLTAFHRVTVGPTRST